MISLDEKTKNWATVGIWKIAPAGLSWIKEGARASIGALSNEAIDLGWADGYRKCISQIDGVAWIGAGCRWFTLEDALKHWSTKPDRELTMCLMQSAVFVAGYKGWAHSKDAAS